MHKKTKRLLTGVAAALCVSAAQAQKPGPLATYDERLDYLLSSWVGHSLEALTDIWGAETEIGRRRDNELYIYEVTSRMRGGFSPFSGTVTVSRGGITCRATFEVDAEQKIVRATRRGGGKTCWDAFRRREPD